MSFEAAEGEIVGIYGLVGSGRTSLAKSLAGAIPMDSGEVRLNGEAISFASNRDGIRHGVVYLSEDRRRDGFVPDFSNAQNMTLSSLQSVSRGTLIAPTRERKLAQNLVARLGVKGQWNSYTTELSGGNQQKVTIARAISAGPQVFIFDEPTKGVDVGARATIYEIMFELIREGKTLVVVSSEAEELLRLAHKVLVMNDGEVTSVVDPSTATTEDLVKPALAASSKDAVIS